MLSSKSLVWTNLVTRFGSSNESEHRYTPRYYKGENITVKSNQMLPSKRTC